MFGLCVSTQVYTVYVRIVHTVYENALIFSLEYLNIKHGASLSHRCIEGGGGLQL